jgi:TetR/AcrR family transcriptional regulator
MKKDISTEQKIKEAAREVFLAKGFSGCSTREIAKAAGMNVALVNYYFRSKSQLFQLIFNAALEDFTNSMVEVFSTDLSLQDKMRILIDKEYDFLSHHPELPAFIITETNRESGCSIDNAVFFEKITETGIFEECQKAQQTGEMIEIDIYSLTLLIISNCDFPYMGRNLMKSILNIEDSQMSSLLNSHKEHVKEMLVNYLFPKNKSDEN